MAPQDLQNLLRNKPFLPFRMHLTDGTAYEVKHPEGVMPFRSIAVVAVNHDPDHGVFGHSVTVTLIHIVRVEYIEAPVKGNGEA